MFELSVALKYLTPRWRQLSISIISLISILVIALVVWLIVVFFSVTYGLEKNWVQKLIALTAPVRITPTDAYYDSYYYRIDGISADSDYTLKSIDEKHAAKKSDPYNPDLDEEIPSTWPAPLLDNEGRLKDPIRIAFQEAEKIPGVTAQDYEMTFSNIRLRLLRDLQGPRLASLEEGSQNQSFISHNAYLGSFDPKSHLLEHAMMPISAEDVNNVLNMVTVASDNIKEDNPDTIFRLDPTTVKERFHRLFNFAEVKSLKTAEQGWKIPNGFFANQSATLQAVALFDQGMIRKILIPLKREGVAPLVKKWQAKGVEASPLTLSIEEGKPYLITKEGKRGTSILPLFLEGDALLQAQLIESSIETAKNSHQLKFLLSFNIQGLTVNAPLPLNGLSIGEVSTKKTFSTPPALPPYWLYQVGGLFTLPSDEKMGESVLLPKAFKEAGVLLGDRGYLSYFSPTASSVQEQRVPIVVTGFYDPGIIPMGGKFILAPRSLTSLIRSAHNQEDTTVGNGINIRFSDMSRAEEIKRALQKAFAKEGILPYFKIETYQEYEFTKDIIQQLHSEKNLFSLLSFVIMVVACSNIISMLIILVNDKKIEIGILRTMGATSYSISAIFGICGVLMGVMGSAIGIVMAIITLKNLQSITAFISAAQGFEMFNPHFYGETLPTELSLEAIMLVIGMTALVSTLAGIVPAVKACLLKPSEILRAE